MLDNCNNSLIEKHKISLILCSNNNKCSSRCRINNISNKGLAKKVIRKEKNKKREREKEKKKKENKTVNKKKWLNQL